VARRRRSPGHLDGRAPVGRAELRLHPAHLGPIEVSVSVNNDEVNVSFQASHPATRKRWKARCQRLRELLGAFGIESRTGERVRSSLRADSARRTALHRRSKAMSSSFEERAVQVDAPIATRVRMGLLDAYA
jgi:flagellar hook-length control protein FliK